VGDVLRVAARFGQHPEAFVAWWECQDLKTRCALLGFESVMVLEGVKKA
jgi:hypothetical protein